MILVVTPDRNVPGKHDYIGAFQPEADMFLARHGGVLVRIDQGLKPAVRYMTLLQAVDEHQPTDLIWFGHGLRRTIPQAGAGKGNVMELAALLAQSTTAPRVVLYACSAASGDGPGGEGGYCDALRDALMTAEAVGARVYGHSTAGHTTRNPYVRVFDRATDVGGRWVVDPASPRFGRWRELLTGPARLQYPWWSDDELARALSDEDDQC